MSDVVKLGTFKNEYELNEIFQSVAIQFAFVDDKYEQIHQPGKCRDFLGDIPWSRYTGKKVSIYGLQYDYSKNPYNTELVRLSLKFPNKGTQENFIKHFSYLTDRERAYNIPESKWFYTDQENTLIVEGDKCWQGCTWKISLYTFYLKVMSYDDVENLQRPELSYKEKLTPEAESKLLADVTSDFNPMAEHLSTNHNSSGFVSTLDCYIHRKMYATQGYDKHYPTAWAVAKRVFGDMW